MKKKLIAVLMVLVLVVASVSAKSNSGFAVGFDAGFGIDKFKKTSTTTVGNTKSTYVYRYKNLGPAFNVNVDYNFNEYWGIRANAGVGVFVKSTVKTDDKYKELSGSTTHAAFDLALDAKYTVHLSDNMTLSALAGVEMLCGHVYKVKDSDDVNKKLNNFAFGVNAGAELAYRINKNFSLKAGATFGYFFVNTTESLKATVKTDNNKVRVASFYTRPYVGVNYAF